MLQFLVVAVAGWINQQPRDVIDSLQEEHRVLREQLGPGRLRFTDAQRRPLAAQATRERQPPAEYLAQVVHLAVTGRRERRIQRRLQEARFPMLKTLDAFQFDAQPELDRDAILQLCSGAFVTEAANVVLVGGVGTGKTHLAIALGMACCQHDYRVRFLTAAELTTLLVEAQQQGRLARKLDQLARFDVVIVDELGYVPFDKAGADLLFGHCQVEAASGRVRR